MRPVASDALKSYYPLHFVLKKTIKMKIDQNENISVENFEETIFFKFHKSHIIV